MKVHDDVTYTIHVHKRDVSVWTEHGNATWQPFREDVEDEHHQIWGWQRGEVHASREVPHGSAHEHEQGDAVANDADDEDERCEVGVEETTDE